MRTRSVIGSFPESLSVHCDVVSPCRVRCSMLPGFATSSISSPLPSITVPCTDCALLGQGRTGGELLSGPAFVACRYLRKQPGLSGPPTVPALALVCQLPSQGSVDGDTMETDTKRIRLAENGLRFQFSLNQVKGDGKGMTQRLAGLKGGAIKPCRRRHFPGGFLPYCLQSTTVVRRLPEMVTASRVLKPVSVVAVRGQSKSRKPRGTAFRGRLRNP